MEKINLTPSEDHCTDNRAQNQMLYRKSITENNIIQPPTHSVFAFLLFSFTVSPTGNIFSFQQTNPYRNKKASKFPYPLLLFQLEWFDSKPLVFAPEHMP